MKQRVKIKAGELNPNTIFFAQVGSVKGGIREQKCRMLSDETGSLKSKVESNGGIFYPSFNDIVEIDETN